MFCPAKEGQNTPAMLIYLRKDGQLVGPYARAELKDMLKHGEVRPNSPAKKEGEAEWSTVEKCLKVEKPAPVSKDSPIPKRFRGGSHVIQTIGSTLGLTAYKKFATGQKGRPRSIAEVNMNSPQRPAADKPSETNQDLLHGAIWIVGGAICMILGYVFSSTLPAEGLYWIFGGPVIFGAILFIRGVVQVFAKR